MTQKVFIRVPQKAKQDLLNYLKMDNPDFSYNIDSFLYIISKLVEIPETNRKYQKLNKIPISSTILRYEIGKNYRKYLDYLLDHKLIDTDNHYIVSTPEREGKCKCYGLTDQYKKCNRVKHEITKKHLLHKIITWKEQNFGKNTDDELVSKLYDMMKRFSIDIEGAKQYLQDLYDSGQINKYKMELELQKCQKINDGRHDKFSLFISKDKYNRVHTNFTNLSKKIRERFLYLDGEKVVGLDVISCQPALLYTLFNDFVKHTENTLGENIDNPLFMPISDKRVDIRDKYVNNKNSYSGDNIYDGNVNFTLTKFDFDSYSDFLQNVRLELQQFKDALQNDIYITFMNKWESMFGGNKDRDEIKKQWVSYVFSKRKNIFTKNMAMIWDRLFPTLNKMLIHFKEGDYRALAHSLQKKEAKFMYGSVCPAVNEQLGIDYCTVHDSIIIKESYTSDVADIFESALHENNIVTGVSINN